MFVILVSTASQIAPHECDSNYEQMKVEKKILRQ